jgi:zinc protease
VVAEEMDLAESSPQHQLSQAVDKLLWGRFASRKDPLGSRRVVLSATPAQLRALQRRWYVPGNALLVVTGDVDAGAVEAEVSRLFGAWPRAPDPFVAEPLRRPPPLQRSVIAWIRQPVRTVTLQLAWPGPSLIPAEVDESYPADLLTSALADPASRFQRALVDGGACLHAGFLWLTQRNVGPITVDLEATPASAVRCLRAALDELSEMRNASYFSTDDLADAVHRVELDRVREREKPSDWAHAISSWWASAGLDYSATYLDRLRAVIRDDLARFTRRWLVGRPFVLGVLLSDEMDGTALTRPGVEDAARWAIHE